LGNVGTDVHGLLHEIYDRLPDQVDGKLVLDDDVSVFYQVQGFEIRK